LNKEKENERKVEGKKEGKLLLILHLRYFPFFFIVPRKKSKMTQ